MKNYPRSGGTSYERAAHIFSVLAPWVDWRMKDKLIRKEHRVPGLITYGQLAVHLGLAPQAGRTLSTSLGHVGCFCKVHGLPALNNVVVNRETGLPGYDTVLSIHDDISEEVSACLNFSPAESYRWTQIQCPRPSQIRKAREKVRESLVD